MPNRFLSITAIFAAIGTIAILAVVTVVVVIPAQQNAEATSIPNPEATFSSEATQPPAATVLSRPTLPPIHTPTTSPSPADTATPRPTTADGPDISTPSFMLPTPAVAPCLCDRNRYDCEYWDNRLEILACFNYCISNGQGDIHELDGDDDGIPCEGPR